MENRCKLEIYKHRNNFGNNYQQRQKLLFFFYNKLELLIFAFLNKIKSMKIFFLDDSKNNVRIWKKFTAFPQMIINFETIEYNLSSINLNSTKSESPRHRKYISTLLEFISQITMEILRVFNLSFALIKKNSVGGKIKISQLLNQFNKVVFVIQILKRVLDQKKTISFFLMDIIEYSEFIRIFSDKNIINLLKVSPQINLTKLNKLYKNKIEIHSTKKEIDNLFILNLKDLKINKYENFLYLLNINLFLINYSLETKNHLNFYQSQRTIKLKIRQKTKELFKFLKKEMYFCSIEITKKNFGNSCRIQVLKSFEYVILEICRKPSFCLHDFDFLRRFLSFFKLINFFSSDFNFIGKSCFIANQSFLIDTFSKLNILKRTGLDKISRKKEDRRRVIFEITKGLILSNNLKKFNGFVYYLFTFKSFKLALENCWRIQLTGRYLDFFGLDLNHSLKFISKIIKFIFIFFNKITVKISKEVLNKSNNQNSNSFNIYFEKFFLKWYKFSGFNSLVVSKQINRVIALGNIYLITIVRIKKIIKNQIFSEENDSGFRYAIKKKKLFKIFHKKIKILLVNLNNSIKFIKTY